MNYDQPLKSDGVRIEAPEECLKCERHGNCPTEFVGGEKFFLSKKEADEVVALFEGTVEALTRDWKTPEHEDQRNIMSDEMESMKKAGVKMNDWHVLDTSVGRDYVAFALHDFMNMSVVISKIEDIVKGANDRNQKLFDEARAQKN